MGHIYIIVDLFLKRPSLWIYKTLVIPVCAYANSARIIKSYSKKAWFTSDHDTMSRYTHVHRLFKESSYFAKKLSGTSKLRKSNTRKIMTRTLDLIRFSRKKTRYSSTGHHLLDLQQNSQQQKVITTYFFQEKDPTKWLVLVKTRSKLLGTV